MRRYATWIALGVVALVAGGGVFVLAQWQSKKVQARRLEFAEELLQSDRAGEALDLLTAENRPTNPEAQQRFGALQVEALRRAGQVDQLRQLYYTSPQWFDSDEEAVLLVARALLAMDDEFHFEQLTDRWENRQTLKSQWFAMRIDRLLKQGERREALRLLESHKFEGKDDFARLSRLALLHAKEPEKAWRFLDQAYELDSENRTLRLFRGNLLETAGRRAEARVEYVAAYIADPTDAAMCDQLAEFYRRCGNHRAAQAIWSDLDPAHSTDFIELKRAFWSRVTAPATTLGSPPPGPWQDFAKYIAELPEERFWDETKFAELKASSSLAKIRQETYWLKLFQLFKDHQAGTASLQDVRRHLIENKVSATYSYSNDLQRALTLATTYRLKGNLNAESIVREGGRSVSRRHRFFDQLDAAHYQWSLEGAAYRTPAELDALLRDDNVYAVIAMAAGWTETAVRLDTGRPLGDGTPTWAAYGMTQAYRMNRGVEAALRYAVNQPRSPLLQVLIGELHLAGGDNEKALRILGEEAAENTEIGMRAAWLAAMALLETERLDEAEKIVRSNLRLETNALGQETLAKIATLRGDADSAAAIYGRIKDESFEAAAYEAKRAYARDDFTTAEQLTLQLLKRMPESIQLRQNLRAIREAQGDHEL